MKKSQDKPADAAELRRRAEKRLKEKPTATGQPLTEADLRRLLQELEVHQIELEMQNEELQQAQVEIEAGLEKYTDLYDFAPTGYFTLERDGAIRQLNLTGARLLGVERSRLVNRRFGLFVSDDSRPAFNALLKKVFESQAKESCEATLLKEGNHQFYVHIEARVSEDGQECHAAMADITERKRAEEALKESEKRYRQVIENATEIIYSLNAKGNFTYGNPAGLKVTGFSLEELRQFNYQDLIVPEYRERLTRVYIKQFRERQATTYVEFPFFNKSGEVVWFGQNASLVIEDGKVVGFHIIARDITERKRSEEALKESEEKYRLVIENADEAIFVAQGEMLRFVNGKATETLGYSKEELTSKPFLEFIHADDREMVWGGHLRQLQGKKTPPVYTFRVINKSMNVKWVELNSVLINWEGKPATLNFMRDITKRKKAEDSLRESVEALRAFLNANPEVSFLMDAKGTVLVANESLFKRFSKSSEEIIGSCLYDLFPEDVTKQRKSQFDEVFRTGKPVHFEDVRMDRNYETFVHPVFDKEGNVAEVAILGFDITERKQTEEALRNSEEKYRTILENIEDGYFEVDIAGNFTFYNDSLCKILGYSRDEMIGMNNRQYTDQENVKKLFQAFNKVYRTGEPTKEFDWEIIRKDGTKRSIEASVSLIKDPSDNRIGFRGIIRDITGRKQAQETLRESEDRYRDLVENSQDLICTHDLQGNFLSVNPAAAKLLGYDRSTILKMNVRDILVPDVRDQFSSYLDTIRRDGVAKGLMLVQTAAGERRILEYNNTLRTEGVASPIVRAINRDITERRRAEQALRESEERYRTLVETSPDAIALFDLNLNVIMVNRPALTLYGYERQEEVIGKSILGYLVPEEQARAREDIRKVLETGSIGPVEYTLLKKDGIRFPAELKASSILDRQKKPSAILCVSRDITERKRAEGEKAILQEQLRQSQKIEAIGRLAGGIAHDFNNLLTVIKGYSQLSLIELKEGDPLKGNIEEVKKAADRAADLTRQLLAFSRRQILEMRVLDLNTVLRDLDKMLHRLIGEDIELVTVFTDDLGRVKTDPGWVEQIIMNLAVNARDAMPSVGKLTIETANVELDGAYARNHIAVTPGRYVMLSMSDTGVGMTPEVRQQVFEPFFTTKEKGKGTGLGLSTVYGIVKQSGGNIWVYSEPGQGTTFKIYLPRVDEPLEEIKERVVKEELPHGSETILVVEDEEEVRKLAVRILQRQGYTVLDAPDGDGALVICGERKDPIHLILTDVVMPGMSGRQLADRLGSFHPEMKVLYMSGYTDNAITHHGVLEKGMNYIQKPFTVDGLARKVREVLDK